MKDRHGHDFNELVSIQKTQLANWTLRVKCEVIEPVSAYVAVTNLQASGPEGSHRVYRGQDLVQIIMDWPDLKPCYAPVIPAEELV